MRLVLLETEGRGGAAEIELLGQRLRVVDTLSAVDRPLPPGEVAGAKLEVVLIPHLTRRESGETSGTEGFEAGQGWRYRAWGELVSRSPPLADFGPLRLALEGADGEGWEVGDRVCVAIDRIVLTRE